MFSRRKKVWGWGRGAEAPVGRRHIILSPYTGACQSRNISAHSKGHILQRRGFPHTHTPMTPARVCYTQWRHSFWIGGRGGRSTLSRPIRRCRRWGRRGDSPQHQRPPPLIRFCPAAGLYANVLDLVSMKTSAKVRKMMPRLFFFSFCGKNCVNLVYALWDLRLLFFANLLRTRCGPVRIFRLECIYEFFFRNGFSKTHNHTWTIALMIIHSSICCCFKTQ